MILMQAFCNTHCNFHMEKTVFFDQNLLERLENATQIKINHYIKENMGQIVLPLIQFLKFIWNKK